MQPASAPALASAADPASEAWQANEAAHRELAAQLREKLAAARLGGGERARARHTARGKLLPRDRVDALLDPGSPFLELSPLAADGMYDGAGPGRRGHRRHRPGRRAARWSSSPTTPRSRAARTTR